MPANNRTFLSDAIDLVAMGSHSLENDDFSNCFKPAPQYKMIKSGILYGFSFFVRYYILFPIRLLALFIGSIFISLLFISGIYFQNEDQISLSFLYFFKLFMIIFNCHVKNHGNKFKLKEPHVYVSNHSSFVDFMLLSAHKFAHACIAENHGGLYGLIFETILKRNGCIAFKRSERRDREEIIKRLERHVKENSTPMLIFPEGTCVNNKNIVLFQKGVFELNTTVVPVAIKYSKNLIDPYWNRRVQSFSTHLFYLMTRWRVDVDVYWMDPVRKNKDENVFQFCHKVKNMIASKISLKNTLWNGYFKSSPALKDRLIFKDAYSITYLKVKYGILDFDKESDIKKGKSYLLDKNINMEEFINKIWFGKLKYKKFINNCCKEYIRIKENHGQGSLTSFLDTLRSKKLIPEKN